MYDAKLVEILDTKGDLVCQILNTLLWKGESSLLNIVKEVFTLHVVQNDEVGLTVLEEINQFDYIIVLTHLQDFNLSALLEHLNWLHIDLFDGLDGSLGAIKLMIS